MPTIDNWLQSALPLPQKHTFAVPQNALFLTEAPTRVFEAALKRHLRDPFFIEKDAGFFGKEHLFKSLLSTAVGVSSAFFPYDTKGMRFSVSLCSHLRLEAMTVDCLKPVLTQVAVMGTLVSRLENIAATYPAYISTSPMHLILCTELRNFLALIRTCIIALGNVSLNFTILELSHRLQTFAYWVCELSRICGCMCATMELSDRIVITSVSDSTCEAFEQGKWVLPSSKLILLRFYKTMNRLHFAAAVDKNSPEFHLMELMIPMFQNLCRPLLHTWSALLGLENCGEISDEDQLIGNLRANGQENQLVKMTHLIHIPVALFELENQDFVPDFIPVELVNDLRHSGLCLQLLQRVNPKHPLLVSRGNFRLALSAVIRPSEVYLFRSAMKNYMESYLYNVLNRETALKRANEDRMVAQKKLILVMESERNALVKKEIFVTSAFSASSAKKSKWRAQVDAFLQDLQKYKANMEQADLAERESFLQAQIAKEIAEQARKDAIRKQIEADHLRRMHELEVRSLKAEWRLKRNERQEERRKVLWDDDRFLAKPVVEADEPVDLMKTEKGESEFVEQNSVKETVYFADLKGEVSSYNQAYENPWLGGINAEGEAANDFGANFGEVSNFSEAETEHIIESCYGPEDKEGSRFDNESTDHTPQAAYKAEATLSSSMEENQIAHSPQSPYSPYGAESTHEPEKNIELEVPNKHTVLSTTLSKPVGCSCHNIPQDLCPTPDSRLLANWTAGKTRTLAVLESSDLETLLELTLFKAVSYRCDIISRETLLVILRDLKFGNELSFIEKSFFLQDAYFAEYCINHATLTYLSSVLTDIRSSNGYGSCVLKDIFGPRSKLKLSYNNSKGRKSLPIQPLNLKYLSNGSPLALLLDESATEIYSAIFSLLLTARACLARLQTLYTNIGLKNYLQTTHAKSLIRFRTTSLEFVSGIVRYFYQAGLAPWGELQSRVERAEQLVFSDILFGIKQQKRKGTKDQIADLRALKQAHDTALEGIRFNLLLTERQKPALELLTDIFSRVSSICGVYLAEHFPELNHSMVEREIYMLESKLEEFRKETFKFKNRKLSTETGNALGINTLDLFIGFEKNAK